MYLRMSLRVLRFDISCLVLELSWCYIGFSWNLMILLKVFFIVFFIVIFLVLICNYI